MVAALPPRGWALLLCVAGVTHCVPIHQQAQEGGAAKVVKTIAGGLKEGTEQVKLGADAAEELQWGAYAEDYGDEGAGNKPARHHIPDDIHWEDMKKVASFDEHAEIEEMRNEENRIKKVLHEEGYRMVNDPIYRDELVDELEDMFPDGADSMGPEEKSLYLLAKELQNGPQTPITSVLDEAEGEMVQGQRADARMQQELAAGVPAAVARAHREAFPVNDRKVGAELDHRRRRAFLQREADLVLHRRKQIHRATNLDEKDRLITEHREATRLLQQRVSHQPGRAAQLGEIWEKQDGLIGIQFNPNTFFKMHDLNEDKILDRAEIEALMEPEAERLHTLGVGEQPDRLAIVEEAARMRDSMIKDYDANKDGMVQFAEFLDFAEGEGFIHDAEWHALNPDVELASAAGVHEGIEQVHLEQLRKIRANPGGTTA